MCGIAGFTTPRSVAAERRRAVYGTTARRMAASLLHRGPDAQTAIVLDGVALAHARLAILDLEGGAQPMRDPATGVTLVYNGEVFNYVELRRELDGFPFRTRSDTEVVLAAFLRWGIDCLSHFNGQFALALYDPRDGALWLARDHAGILPLQYTFTPDGIAFASEAKALVAAGFVEPVVDPIALKQTMQLWSPVAPRTCLSGVFALPAGWYGRFAGGRWESRRWWDLDLGREPDDVSEDDAIERVGALLEDAVRVRLRADVPVGAYLSGGIDSSVLCALAQRQLGGSLSTYSVAFEDPAFDESRYQLEVANMLETRHRSILSTSACVGELLPDVVWQGEQVLIRAAPAPLLTLSGLVRESGGKVVLTGEGSDEIFLGYDLYAETRARLFWSRRPTSGWRPALLRRLYPYLALGGQGDAVLRATFGPGIDRPHAPEFSHLVRWTACARSWRVLAPDLARSLEREDPIASVLATMPAGFAGWRPLARAQHLEMETLLAGYLLSAQGDRMLMGHSVEGRFPFLDRRLMELAARLPERLKLPSLAGKWVLRRYARSLVPETVLTRPKMPYRAPPARLLVGDAAPPWARELLAPDALRRTGLFDPDKVSKLTAKLAAARGAASEVDAMAINAVASAQLLPHVLSTRAPAPGAVAAVALEVA